MKFSLRRLLAAVALAAAALAFERSLDTLSAGGSTAAAALFVAMFTASGAAFGLLCHRGRLGAIIGLVLAGILSPFFWIVWSAADC